VALAVCPRRRRLGEGEELVAHLDERHPRLALHRAELEDPRVERERLVEVADLERDVVDADEPCTLAHVLDVRLARAHQEEAQAFERGNGGRCPAPSFAMTRRFA
jgi:hypothetical protein